MSGGWERYGYLLQAGNQCFLKHSGPLTIVFLYRNIYGLFTRAALSEMSNINFFTEKLLQKLCETSAKMDHINILRTVQYPYPVMLADI